MSAFHMWMIGYHNFNFFPIKVYIKRVFSLVFYKINFGVLKFKSKTKTQIVKLNDLKKILQHLYKSFNINFLDQHDIKGALHKYV
jgi:hypothetical protein